MKRRSFLASAGLPAAVLIGDVARAETSLLGQDFVVLRESQDPARLQLYSPGLARLKSGRIVATNDVAARKQEELPGSVRVEGGRFWINEVHTSDDRGRTWVQRGQSPMMHARPFEAGGAVYVLGHAHDLTITRSNDGGETWSGPHRLTEGQSWHQAPCNVLFRNDRVYLVMERITDPLFREWPVSVLAPVVLSAKISDDLTRRENWVFSSELVFRDVVAALGPPRHAGVPFLKRGPQTPLAKDRRNMAPIGWLETNLVHFSDDRHVWHDPTGRTLHLWMRAHTGATNLACIAKAVESEDRRSIRVTYESAPSGEPLLYVPCPGGHLKFHILQDPQTSLYWLLSSQSTDSMTRPQHLPEDRYNLPNNERHRLALHVSRNCVDWMFTGLVAKGGSPKQARHYASMVIDGEDLLILSRSGDQRAASAHDGNLITLHTVKEFRRLGTELL